MEKLMLKNWLTRNGASRSSQPRSRGRGRSRTCPQENGFLIELRRVVKKYTGTAGSVTALNGVDLQIGAGEFLVVLGKSGAGKTTLVNMITGIDRPTSGEIRWAKTSEPCGGAATWASSCSSFNSCLR
jgi:ABC-type glutathione transport system ATPase component